MSVHAERKRLITQLVMAMSVVLSVVISSVITANPVEDPNNVGWSSIRGYSSEKFAEYFKKKSADGYRMIDIEVYKVSGKARYAAVWQFNTDKRGWASFRNMTHDGFSQKWKAYRDKGYRLIDQEAYSIGGKRRYAGIWVQNKENVGWVSFRNVDTDAFSKNFKKYSEQGYRMTDIEAYAVGAKTRYSGIFVKNTSNLAWSERRNMSASNYAKRFKEMAGKGYRVVDIESYKRGGKRQYAAIWVKNKNNRGWAAWRDMTATGFGNKWRGLRDEGYRLIDFEAYATGGGVRYAGVWRQNGNKLDWSHKKQIDTAVKAYRKKHGIPGMSVAVAEKGNIVYARGFGRAHINKNKEAHAGTIYRLASVSKPITALVALRLLERNQLKLGDKTRKHAPGLPAHHTHTVRQIIEHKSGMRHYKGSNRNNKCPVPKNRKWKDSSNKKYKTATAAAKLIQNDPLMYTPGAKSCYSTHAYTLLAAALEGAGNKSFTALIRSELSNRLKLPTLRPEEVDRSVSERSRIYNSKTNQIKHKPLNWKHAGGGLEASIIDLTRLGIKVNTANAVKVDTRKKIWGGSQFSHSGSQDGAKSYWRMYFDDNKVISILSNRDKGDPGKLADEIAGIIN